MVAFSEKIFFAQYLALMIKAGIPLREGIAVIQEQSKNRKFKKILEQVIRNIDRGQSLSLSLAKHPRVFSPLYTSIIQIGEESGTLEENLEYLVVLLEKNRDLRRKIKGAMVYPATILFMASILTVFITYFVMPKIIPLFESLNIKLPLITRILIWITKTLQAYGLFILIAILFLVVILTLFYRIRLIKFLIHKLLLKLPIIGSISRNFNISQFGRTFGILFKSGLPITRALEITGDILSNLVYKREFKKIKIEVEKGKTISDYLKKKESLFPLMVSQMIRVGERAGKLEEVLFYLSGYYEKEVDKSIKKFSSFLEPLLLLIIGTIVGFIALAIISPIYEITRGL